MGAARIEQPGRRVEPCGGHGPVGKAPDKPPVGNVLANQPVRQQGRAEPADGGVANGAGRREHQVPVHRLLENVPGDAAKQPATAIVAEREAQHPVGGKIGRPVECRRAGKVGRGGDHQIAGVHQLRDNDVAFDRGRQADREIYPFSDEVDIGVGEEALHADARKGAAEPAEQGNDDLLPEGNGGRQPQGAARPGAGVAGRRQGVFQFLGGALALGRAVGLSLGLGRGDC